MGNKDRDDVEDVLSWIQPDMRVDVNIKDSVDTLVQILKK